MAYDYRSDQHGSIIPPKIGRHGPLYHAVAFGFRDTNEGKRIFDGSQKGYAYSRIGNPGVRVLEEKILKGEAGELDGFDAITTNSGMSAIALIVLQLASHEHKRLNIVLSPAVYGGTYDLLVHLVKKLKIDVRVVEDMHNLNAWERMIDDQTAFLFIETPANPQLKTFDIQAFADMAHTHDTLLVVDNTICTFVGQRPLMFGADIVVMSTTKSINGNCDALGGAIVARDEIINGNPSVDDLGIRFGWAIDMGTAMDPDAADRTLYGMQNLKKRVKRASKNAHTLAEFFSVHSKVKTTYFPFPLHGKPIDDYIVWQMSESGCLLGFELEGDIETACTFIDSIAKNSPHIFHGPHLGGHMTMIAHPVSTTHARVDPGAMKKLGISPTFIRVSAGIENKQQFKKVIEDFESAFLKI